MPTEMKKKVALILLFALIIIQFFPIDTQNPEANPNDDFLRIIGQEQTATGELIKAACYNCHSHETKYPAYTRFQPVGFYLRSHIRGGRQKLNFSSWSNYTEKKKIQKLEECIEVIEEKRMPLKSYTWLHPEGKVSKSDRAKLIKFFSDI